MGGGSGRWRSPYHTLNETAGAINAQNYAEEYRRRAAEALNRIYTELDYEQSRVQNNAFAKEMQALLNTKDIEWKIFEQQVKKAQANYIANLYTKRIILELKNLEAIVNEK